MPANTMTAAAKPHAGCNQPNQPRPRRDGDEYCLHRRRFMFEYMARVVDESGATANVAGALKAAEEVFFELISLLAG